MHQELFVLLLSIAFISGAQRCVWISGQVACNSNPEKSSNVEIRALDRDGLLFAKFIDPDDLMAITFSHEDGTFNLDGCGDDHDWIRGILNEPDPYITILHYCNNSSGETIKRKLKLIFAPDTIDLGIVNLD